MLDDSTDDIANRTELEGAGPEADSFAISLQSLVCQAGTIGFFPPGVPKRIGRYTLIRFIGSGGFGMVFEALDTTLQRHVAIKLPKAEVTLNPEAVKCFLDEARAVSNMEHPGIVVPFDAGVLESQPYIAYPFCSGPSLSRWMLERKEPVSPELAARIVLKVAEAVSYSHESNVLHRDIKPGNILLFPSASGPPDFPYDIKLTDFGLAKVAEIGFGVASSSLIVGTPLYLAPEELSLTRRASESVDIYSLGVVLYQLLTDRNPFESDDLLELVRQIREDSPALPSSVRKSIPPGLNTICITCLEKDPRHRYAAARDLAEDLRRFLAGRELLAKPVPRLRGLWCWLSNHERRREVGVASIFFSIFIFLWSVLGLVALHYSGDYTVNWNTALSNIIPLAITVAIPLVIAGRGVARGSRIHCWAGIASTSVGLIVSLLSFTPFPVAFPEIYGSNSIARTIVFTMLGLAFFGVLLMYSTILTFWKTDLD